MVAAALQIDIWKNIRRPVVYYNTFPQQPACGAACIGPATGGLPLGYSQAERISA